jgi:hypothetical protein
LLLEVIAVFLFVDLVLLAVVSWFLLRLIQSVVTSQPVPDVGRDPWLRR